MMDFQGRAKRLDDIDLPRLGALIGVGEDEIHAVLDVESRGSGFDLQGRPLILFEPHVFWRELGPGAKRDIAVRKGLAYQKWGERPYPSDSYPRLIDAMKIDETAALKSASWGLGQILGRNYSAAGYSSVQALVHDFCDDEENHLRAMINFIRSNNLASALRRHDWKAFARGYNGPDYAKNSYDVRLARSYDKWRRIPDSKWRPADAIVETILEDSARNVTADLPPPPLTPASISEPATVPVSVPPRTFWQRFKAAFAKRTA